MKRPFSYLFFSLLAVLLAMPIRLQAYPFLFKRLGLYKDGKLVKVIDLISDLHLKENHYHGILVAQTGPSENALFESLVKIGDRTQGEVIGLIVESAPLLRAYNNKDKGSGAFLIHTLAKWFNQNYSVEQGKHIIYSDGDAYRFCASDFAQALRLMLSSDGPVEFDLNILAQKNPQAFRTVKSFWDALKGESIMPFSDFAQKNNLSFSIMDAAFGKLNRYDELDKNAVAQSVFRPIEIELLIKAFISRQRHTIIYAGGIHSAALSQLLQNCFSFQLMQTLGNELTQKALEIMHVELMKKCSGAYTFQEWSQFLQKNAPAPIEPHHWAEVYTLNNQMNIVIESANL